MRTIGLCYREFTREEWEAFSAKHNQWASDDDINQLDAEECTFIGLLGAMDMLRRGVPEAVEACQAAGVTVRMLTGDNIDTASYYGLQAGIIATE